MGPGSLFVVCFFGVVWVVVRLEVVVTIMAGAAWWLPGPTSFFFVAEGASIGGVGGGGPVGGE